MRITRLLAVFAIALAAVAFPGTAHAASITQPFAADSGDACPYGTTSGTLTWRFGTSSPLPLTAVDVKGKLADRPLLADPGSFCRDDGFFSSVSFVAYASTVEIDRQSRAVNNGTVSFEFTLGRDSAAARINRVVIQVCRSPIFTLPPSYCGKEVTFLVPPIA
ncbi:MAG TPA: hypothetical protein VF062_22135 [Candidatus Limnocylindrales bacterium]